MVKVVALGTYKKLGVMDREQGKVLEPGTVFEVTEERLEVLLGKNPYKAIFVTVKDEEPVVEEEPKPKKRGRKKKE